MEGELLDFLRRKNIPIGPPVRFPGEPIGYIRQPITSMPDVQHHINEELWDQLFPPTEYTTEAPHPPEDATDDSPPLEDATDDSMHGSSEDESEDESYQLYRQRVGRMILGILGEIPRDEDQPRVLRRIRRHIRRFLFH